MSTIILYDRHQPPGYQYQKMSMKQERDKVIKDTAHPLGHLYPSVGATGDVHGGHISEFQIPNISKIERLTY